MKLRVTDNRATTRCALCRGAPDADVWQSCTCGAGLHPSCLTELDVSRCPILGCERPLDRQPWRSVRQIVPGRRFVARRIPPARPRVEVLPGLQRPPRAPRRLRVFKTLAFAAGGLAALFGLLLPVGFFPVPESRGLDAGLWLMQAFIGCAFSFVLLSAAEGIWTLRDSSVANAERPWITASTGETRPAAKSAGLGPQVEARP